MGTAHSCGLYAMLGQILGQTVTEKRCKAQSSSQSVPVQSVIETSWPKNQPDPDSEAQQQKSRGGLTPAQYSRAVLEEGCWFATVSLLRSAATVQAGTKEDGVCPRVNWVTKGFKCIFETFKALKLSSLVK